MSRFGKGLFRPIISTTARDPDCGVPPESLAIWHSSPMTTTLTAEPEAATMRPVFAERTRTFSAVKGKHKVEGRERRTHRFTWVTDKALTK